MISMTSWVDLAISVCLSVNLYISEQVPQFLRYRSKLLHTSFSSQEPTHLLEPAISEHYSIYISISSSWMENFVDVKGIIASLQPKLTFFLVFFYIFIFFFFRFINNILYCLFFTFAFCSFSTLLCLFNHSVIYIVFEACGLFYFGPFDGTRRRSGGVELLEARQCAFELTDLSWY